MGSNPRRLVHPLCCPCFKKEFSRGSENPSKVMALKKEASVGYCFLNLYFRVTSCTDFDRRNSERVLVT